jgi:protein Mpv17
MYNRASKERPIVTSCITSGLLMGGGDVMCQAILRRTGHSSEKVLEPERSVHMASWGVCVYGPLAHAWYSRLDHWIPIPGRVGTWAKIAADQLILTPPLTVGFFTWMHALQGIDIQSSFEALKQKLLPTLLADCGVWPLVHYVTFAYVPVSLRVLWVNNANLFWNSFLSFMAH